MEDLILEIVAQIKAGKTVDVQALDAILRVANKKLGAAKRTYSKKPLLPFYLRIKNEEPERWKTWKIDEVTEKKLVRALQIKPRRTASGVATITVLTKPWRCSSACVYCPNDLAMPKSYMSNEPACQRAERNHFDPYLQVFTRLRALHQMGHVTDKVELIVLGGTWSDYSSEYQIWFIKELFRALNNGDTPESESIANERRTFYENIGLSSDKSKIDEFTQPLQQRIDSGELTYNQAWKSLYDKSEVWRSLLNWQRATMPELYTEHERNINGKHRVVGLVIETRPDAINAQRLHLIRELGCTKVQIGIQSLQSATLQLNKRNMQVEKIREAFALLRLYGFKIHAHFMVNLYGMTPELDKKDYYEFVNDPYYLPDEIKLYPCVLIAGTALCDLYERGLWQPYTELELLDVLIYDTLATPPYTRISRMIRDFSSQDIKAGNKKVNLRQLVEKRIEEEAENIKEIRYREISVAKANVEELHLDIVRYDTHNTNEYFLQWVTPENKIAGFLRLSLPDCDYVAARQADLAVLPNEAMIREIHVYGAVAGLNKTSAGAQHLGLGKQLVKEAVAIAQKSGYAKLNVISAVGTRAYYERLGFAENGLYQQMDISPNTL